MYRFIVNGRPFGMDMSLDCILDLIKIQAECSGNTAKFEIHPIAEVI